jgi:hypothetical protein
LSKALLVIFHSRNIPQFLDAVSNLKIDKLWMNYYPQHLAYPLARHEFLKREYTHMVILADDLIVKQRDIDILTNECDKYDIISGWCNLWHIGPYKDLSNISFKLPPDPPAGGSTEAYRFIPSAYMEILKEANPYKPVIPVAHQGTALTFIKREIVEKIDLQTDLGCCPDSMLSLNLAKMGITQHIDLRVRMLHLKEFDNPDTLVDKEPSGIKFEAA